MAYWLMKSEPDVFSIDTLARDGVASWDGVRNYQARNYMRAMKSGDDILFYHSSAKPPAIVGRMTLAREAYPDPTQFDKKNDHYDPSSTPASPIWSQVDVRFVEKFLRPLTLDEIKQVPDLGDMLLLSRSRLSVQPLTPKQWKLILSLVSFLIMVLLAGPAEAACAYFRTAYRVNSCKASTVEPAPVYDTQQNVDPLVESSEKDDGKRIRLVCECEYTLSGSDQRCDVDRRFEREALINSLDVKKVCRQGKARCKEICLPRISDGESR